MRMALIRDGLVVNVIEAGRDFVPEDGIRALPAEEAGPGWRHADGQFVPPPEFASAPQYVSMFQAREALRRTKSARGGNLLDDVNAFVESQRLDQPTLALAWEYGAKVERRGGFVVALAKTFNLDDAALDDLFRLAATIEA